MIKAIWDYLTSVFRPVKGDIPSLNPLRVFGLLAVITAHFAQTLEANDRILNYSIYLRNIYDSASQFMDMFFVLSGFLIAGPLIARMESGKKLKFLEYFIKRTFRIFPAFYIFIAFYAFLLAPASLGKHADTAAAVQQIQNRAYVEFLYLSNYLEGIQYHTWSLALEEQFYLLIPFFLALVYIRTPSRNREWLLIGLYVLPLLYRIWAYFTFMSDVPSDEMTHAYHKYIYHPFHAHCDSLIMGVLLGRLHSARSVELKNFFANKTLSSSILAAGTVVIIPVSLFTNEFEYGFLNQVVRFNIFSLYYGYLILMLVYRPEFWLSRLFSYSIFSAPAKLTYTAYIIHVLGSLFAFQLFIGLGWMPADGYIQHSHVALYGVAGGLCIMALAYFYYLLTEKPFMALRDWIIGRMKGRPTQHLHPEQSR
ncbi:MAG: acyltransferase [Leptospiraceae bacterium]|nr:acyltransferase [Leptospiraceae bacterium]